MREFIKISDKGEAVGLESLILTYAQRERSRLKASLASGEEIGLFLPRGTILKAGDVVVSENGDALEITAAAETVSTVTASSPHLLLRIAYHLGNRHVPLQVEANWLRYRHDHVLDDMVRLLGGEVAVEQQPIQPEGGAYGGGHHGHSHGADEGAHSHSNEHGHGHSHEH